MPRIVRRLGRAVSLVVLVFAGQGCCAAHSSGDDDADLCEILELGLARWWESPLERCHLDDPLDADGPDICAPGSPIAEILDEALESGRLTVDVAQVEACRAAARGSYPLETVGDLLAIRDRLDEALESLPECDHAFVGHQAEGEPCQLSFECQEGLACDIDLASLEKLCLRPAVEGERCNISAPRRCEEGLECLVQICTAPLPEGAPCDLDGLACGPGLVCTGGVCEPLSGLGESCTSDGHCEEGLRCGETTLCEPLPRTGEPCVEGDRCATPCDVCRPEGAARDLRCGPRGGEGEPCSGHDHCRLGFYCEGGEGVCLPTLPTGGACTENEQCDDRTAFCDGGRCARLGRVGEDCDGPFTCEDGLYCAGGECRAGEEGDPCGDDFDCMSYVCDGDGLGSEGVCAPPGEAGDACSSETECGEGLGCVEGVCIPRGGIGAPCGEDRECFSDTCVHPQGRCGPAPGEESDCAFAIDVDGNLLSHWLLLSAVLAPQLLKRRRRRGS